MLKDNSTETGVGRGRKDGPDSSTSYFLCNHETYFCDYDGDFRCYRCGKKLHRDFDGKLKSSTYSSPINPETDDVNLGK